MSDSDATAEVLLATIDAQAKSILEECGLDGIQIVSSYVDADGFTRLITAGHGNWHSRYGAIAEVEARWRHQFPNTERG